MYIVTLKSKTKKPEIWYDLSNTACETINYFKF